MSFWSQPRQQWWRKALFQVHLWCGLLLGIYFVVVCLTGSVIVYKKELERQQIPALVRVPPGESWGSFAAMVALVQAAYPQHQLQNAYLYTEPGTSWSFRLQGKQGRVQAYVDPYRVRLLGQDTYHDKFLQWVYDLHTDLLLGSTGAYWNGWGGLLLAGMCVSGLVVWWPGQRVWRQGFSWAQRARWKRKNYDVHKLSGLASSGVLAVLAVTGAYWSFPESYERTLAWVTQGPAKRNPPVVVEQAGRPRASLDQVLAAARAAIPQGEMTLFRFAGKTGTPHSLHVRLPGDWRTQGDNVAYVHPQTAEVVRVDYHAALPLGVRLQRDIYGLHFGTFGGDASRVVWLMVGVVPMVLFGSGLLMYWNRVLSKRVAAWQRKDGERTDGGGKDGTREGGQAAEREMAMRR